MNNEAGETTTPSPGGVGSVKRRELLRLGTLASALTGAFALSGLGDSRAEAAPGQITEKDLAATYVKLVEKGANLGVATLDSASKVPLSQIPDLSKFYSKYVNVVADGATDNRAAIQAALDSAGSLGGARVLLPPGTIRIASAISMPANTTLDGCGANTTRLVTAGGPLVTATGTQESTVSITADAVQRSSQITVSSTTGLSAGAKIVIGSNALIDPGTPTDYVGEILRIRSVDNGTQFTVWGEVRGNYLVADSAGMRKLNPVHGIGLKNLSLVNTAPNTTTSPLTVFETVEAIRVEGVAFLSGDGTGLWLRNVYGADVDGCYFQDVPDQTGGTPARFGYGIATYAAAEGIKISGCRFTRLRHSFTANGGGGSWGQARGVNVTGCIATECTGPAFDTHPGASGVNFVANTVSNCTHAAFQLRGPGNKVLANNVNDCAAGVWVTSLAHGAEIRGNTFRNLGGPFTGSGELVAATATGAGQGVQIFDTPGVTIADNTFERCLRQGITVSPSSSATSIRLHVLGNRFINIGQQTVSNWAIQFSTNVSDIKDCLILGNLFGVYSTADTGPCGTGTMGSVVHVDSATVTSMTISDNDYFGTVPGGLIDGTSSANPNIIQRRNRKIDTTYNETLQGFTALSASTVRANFTTEGFLLVGTGGASYIYAAGTSGALRLGQSSSNSKALEIAASSLNFPDAYNIAFNTTTGTKIGTGPSQKLAFYGVTPVVRPTSTPAAATDAATTQALVNDLRSKLIALGLIS